MLCSTGGAPKAPDVVVVISSPPLQVVRSWNDNLVFIGKSLNDASRINHATAIRNVLPKHSAPFAILKLIF
jgi:hypothetical protein